MCALRCLVALLAMAAFHCSPNQYSVCVGSWLSHGCQLSHIITLKMHTNRLTMWAQRRAERSRTKPSLTIRRTLHVCALSSCYRNAFKIGKLIKNRYSRFTLIFCSYFSSPIPFLSSSVCVYARALFSFRFSTVNLNMSNECVHFVIHSPNPFTFIRSGTKIECD